MMLQRGSLTPILDEVRDVFIGLEYDLNVQIAELTQWQIQWKAAQQSLPKEKDFFSDLEI